MGCQTLLFVLIALGISAQNTLAADISGEWAAEMVRRIDGKRMKVTFEFKVDGNKLTGSMLDYLETEEPILDGKVEGNQISFTIENDSPKSKYIFKGTVSGDTIHFKITDKGGRRGTWQYVAKRVSP